MLYRRYIALPVLIFLVAMPLASDAANLRGRLNGQNRYSAAPYPIAGAVVELFVREQNKWRSLGRDLTGSDGMYFFTEVKPGIYVLQINGRQNYPIRVEARPYQDLPPILISY